MILDFEMQELADHEVGAGVVDFGPQEDHSIGQEAGVQVVGAFTPGRLFDNGWDEIAHGVLRSFEGWAQYATN